MDILCNYAGYKRCVPILVFDAYKVRGGAREVEKYHNLYVVYTREAETADMYIERATHELAREHRTRVVSSDGAEQIIVMGHGALRVSAARLRRRSTRSKRRSANFWRNNISRCAKDAQRLLYLLFYRFRLPAQLHGAVKTAPTTLRRKLCREGS